MSLFFKDFRSRKDGSDNQMITFPEAEVTTTSSTGGLIEKITTYTDVAYAVVLYTECDLGRDKNMPVNEERFRARQNVVFEHGYLIAKLGREKVSAFVKGDVETPGDISGVVYTKMDSSGAWKQELVREMIASNVDFNRLLQLSFLTKSEKNSSF